MKDFFWKISYFILQIVFSAIFCLEVWIIAKQFIILSEMHHQSESAVTTLQSDLNTVNNLIRQNQAKSDELEYLLSLVNILPEDKGYLRTQKVISEEVGSLRKTVSRKVAGKIHIVIDSKPNKIYLKKGLDLLWQADCSVGRGGVLTDKKTGRKWEFVTPKGEFRILTKIENPAWIKPDWAFIESDQPIPPPEDPLRRVEGELGAYVLSLGDGYLIHGTKNEDALGRAVSHGCVRLGAKELENLFHSVSVGTKVYIF